MSYRWSGDTFKSVVETIALGLVRRGYEAVFDGWYIDDSIEEPALHMLRELHGATHFLAAISPDFLSVLDGTVVSTEFGAPDSHDVRNDGWVRDELNLVLMAQNEYRGVGLRFGAVLDPDPRFPFPTFDVSDNQDLSAKLDLLFGPALDLPISVEPEIKHVGNWIMLPAVPLTLAYRAVRTALSIIATDPEAYFTHPHSLPLWSRLDRRHLIWEARAVDASPRHHGHADTVLCCPSCTAQFKTGTAQSQCPRCRNGALLQRVPGKVEALVVMRPTARQ